MVQHPSALLRAVIIACVLCTAMLTLPGKAEAKVSDSSMQGIPEPAASDIDRAQDGMVGIQVGLIQNNDFKRVRRTTGFLIGRDGNQSYVVTTAHSLEISGKDRSDAGADENAAPAYKLIVRGDVSADLTIKAESEKQYDFCILQTADAARQKPCVKLEDGRSPQSGDPVNAIGFPKGDNLQYEADEVQLRSGSVDTVASDDGAEYIVHSAAFDRSGNGGALVNDEGYVLGMNNYRESDGEKYHSLKISEIEKVLREYEIPYGSRKRDEAYEKLYDHCTEAVKQCSQKRYTYETRQALENRVQNGIEVLRGAPQDLDQLEEADDLIVQAQNGLESKTRKTTWVIIGLGAVLLYVFIRFIRLLRWRRREKKKSQMEGNAGEQTSPEGAYPPPVPEPGPSMPEPPVHGSVSSSWSDSEPTTTVREAPRAPAPGAPRAVLRWRRGKQEISVKMPVFVLGKQAESADFVIRGNQAVSRAHAKIEWTQTGGYRIYDLQSSNGTFVNDQRVLQDGAPLRNGDIIRIADEMFRFKLMS